MQRKSFFRGLILALATVSLVATAAAPVLAKETRKSYIVVLAGDPIATYKGGVDRVCEDEGPGGQEGRRELRPGKAVRQVPGVPTQQVTQVGRNRHGCQGA